MAQIVSVRSCELRSDMLHGVGAPLTGGLLLGRSRMEAIGHWSAHACESWSGRVEAAAGALPGVAQLLPGVARLPPDACADCLGQRGGVQGRRREQSGWNEHGRIHAHGHGGAYAGILGVRLHWSQPWARANGPKQAC